MIANGPIQLRPGFRILTAISLFIWLAAIGICTAHCSVGFLNAKSKTPGHCCQQKESKETAKSSCLVNTSVKAADNSITHIAPQLHLAYFLTTLALLEDGLSAQTLISPFRQGSPSDWPAVPEVYLGAAHFSLAPPFQG